MMNSCEWPYPYEPNHHNNAKVFPFVAVGSFLDLAHKKKVWVRDLLACYLGVAIRVHIVLIYRYKTI
jgi:hypothetical protein